MSERASEVAVVSRKVACRSFRCYIFNGHNVLGCLQGELGAKEKQRRGGVVVAG